MARITFDESCWPLVIVRYPRAFNQAEFDEHLAYVVSLVRRDEPWAMINDSRGAYTPNARQRGAIAEFYAAEAALVRKNWRSTALVIDNPLVAGIATAISWLTEPLHPFCAFWNYADAERYVLNHFEPGLRDLVAQRLRASRALEASG